MPTPPPVQCPVLVGRDHLLDLADEAIREVASGRGRTLLIAGEAGIGKTRLIGAISRKTDAAGFAWAQGNVAPDDADVPLALLTDTFRTMLEDPEQDAVGQDLLARCLAASTEGRTYSRTLVVDLVARWREAFDRPTIVIFEDLQWADDISLAAIGELARLAPRHPVLVIGVYRRDEAPPGTPLRDWRSRLLTQRHATEVRLERLTVDETAVMTTLLLGTGMPAPRTVVEAVHARSDGLPLHVEELIAAARSLGPLDASTIRSAHVPDTIEDAILARIARRSAEARAVAEAGAVMGRCFAPSVLAKVMDRSEAELDAPLRELADHGILFGFGTIDEGYYDFRHQLLRDTLYHHASERSRQRLHARAGEFGGALIGATEVHASVHFEQAGLTEQAFRAAVAGAEAAVRFSAHREAFELYRRAVRNLPDTLPDAERADVLVRCADEALAVEENEFGEGLYREARTLYRAAGRIVDAIMCLSAIDSVLRRMGRPLSERSRLTQEAMRELDSAPGGPARDDAAINLAFDQFVNEVDRLDLDAARATGQGVLDRLGDIPGADGYATWFLGRMAMIDVLAGDPDGGIAAIARLASDARDQRQEEAAIAAFRDAAVFAVRALDYPTAEALVAEGLVYADSIQQSHCAHVMHALHAEIDWAAGMWAEAVAAGEQAMADIGCLRAPAMAAWATGYVAFGRGEVDRARALFESSRSFGETSELIEWRLPPLWGFAEVAVLEGDARAAIERCETALGLCIASGERAFLAMFIVTGVRAYQAAGRPADAERWLARCAAHLAATPAFGRAALDHGAGLVALAAGATSTARSSLEAAVAGWGRSRRAWEGWWARLDLAACHARANRFAAAVALATEVREAALRVGSPSLVDRAEEILRLARGRVVTEEPWSPLTAREFEVARLITEGLTNAEIADELGIAPKTASSHVEHILAKLGVSRRAEIAAWAATIATVSSTF